MADITQNINYNYKTNVQTMTRYHDRFNAALGRTQRTTQRLTRAIGTKDKYALRSEKVTYRNAKATNRLSGSMGGLQGTVGGLALRFVGYQMILGQIMGAQQKLIEWVKKSITEFREFEKKMAEVSTIISDLTTGPMPRLTAGVESLSIRFGKSATDMAKGLYDILSAAFDSEDAIRLLATATKASIAGLADVSTSVDIFTSVLNAYGMTASQAAHISDIFFQTIRRGKLIFEDLASAIGYVTPIAAAAGVAFEEIAAILATVTRMGLHVDMASRGLALTIQNIVSPTKQASAAARKYNIDMSGLALRVKGLEGFMVALNKAVKEHGATILPEMIRNMRSLRVVMAITSDEGIAGMTTDLDLMAKSAGQTQKAMAKMTAVTQMQVDILAQSMAFVERRIGEAWSGFDIWWKKTQLWWGTLIAGGDANKAIKDFDTRILELNKAFLALLSTQTALAGKGTLMSEMLDIDVDINKLIPWSSINQYMEIEDKKRVQSERMVDLLKKQMELELELAEARVHPELAKMPRLDWYAIGFKEDEAGRKAAADALTELESLLDKVNNEIASGKNQLMDWQSQQEALQPSFDFLTAGLDDLSASMGEHKTNIIELQAAMDELKISVLDTYTAMSGQKFVGRLGWEIAVKESGIFIDRFNKFAGMAIKYGDEFSAIEWFDRDIWDMINGIEAYDGSIQDIINTLHKYSDATEELTKVQKKAKDAEDELTASIRRNNLEIMKIQLAGMMRRRGLTRSEQKIIKKIEIENAQWRIDQLTNTIAFEDEIERMHIDALDEQYKEAKNILDEYTARSEFNLYLLKDIREDDIDNLRELHAKKEDLLAKYVQWEKDEIQELTNEHEAYITILAEIAERPDIDAMYKKLYGFDAAQESIAELERLRKFQSETGLITAPTVVKTPAALPGMFDPFKLIRKFLPPGSFPIPEHKQGISYVPKTQLAMVHRGERITPAGANATGDTYQIEINVNAKVDTNYDVERLAARLGVAMQTQLADKRGKSKYRMR